MNYLKSLLAVGLLGLVACQKPAATGIDEALVNASQCETDASEASGDLKIVGESAAQSGSALTYSLKSSGSCVNGQSVNWKAAGASRTLTTATGLTSIFKKAGTYVITAQEKTATSSADQVSIRTTVVSQEMTVSGPQAAFSFSTVAFEVVTPSDVTPASIVWNFGDGTATVTATKNVEHVYYDTGNFTLSVTVTDTAGQVKTVTHPISILTMVDGMNCIQDVSIAGPSEAKVKVDTAMHVFIPPCMTDKVGAVRWDFGDGQTGANQSVTHAYQAIGTYAVTATLYQGTSQEPWIVLHHSIRVIENLDDTPDPEQPVDPNACSVQGETRESQGELYSETVACGLNGTKTVTYRDRIKEECKLVVEKLAWTEVSRTKEITNEGPCEGQSCKLPDGSLLNHGSSVTLYSTSTPAGSCASVAETRTCTNGVLSGSSSYTQTTCHNGCGDFGSHGTVKTGVVTGEIKVPLQCSFGEEGFFDRYTQISDQTCNDGQIVTSNTRQGTLTEAGKCPTYSYVGTENFTACSADCGGKQTRIFVCRDDKGVQVDNIRCGSQVPPVEERVCDGNPDAVRRQESATTTEEANSSSLCPANQIGVIVKTRDVVTTKTYACIDHSVQLESEVAVPGPWVEEKYCRDYVPRRCSQDSLSNSEAKGRYEWMVKCQNELPIIKEFLENFADVKISVSGQKVSINSSSRELYPTFMNYAYNPERPWIAPKNKNAPCVMPSTVYVATICVSSCATPDQQILVRDKENKGMKYMSFFDALTQNMSHVASMHNMHNMNSTLVAKTKVDQWVTELIDSEHDILVFKMKSGRELKVTPNHVLVTAEGTLKLASEFKSKDALVQLGGQLDPIVSITPVKYFGKVYNVFVQSNDVYKNILVTNGYLNGSAYFQNAGAKELNRVLFRQNMTRGVFDR